MEEGIPRKPYEVSDVFRIKYRQDSCCPQYSPVNNEVRRLRRTRVIKLIYKCLNVIHERPDVSPEPLIAGPERFIAGPERFIAGPESLIAGPERLGGAPESLAVHSESLIAGPESLIAGPERLAVHCKRSAKAVWRENVRAPVSEDEGERPDVGGTLSAE
jgi:hypothetical protein